MAIFRIPLKLTWPASGSPGVNVFHLRTTESSGTAGNDLIVSDALGVLTTYVQSWYATVGVTGIAWTLGEDVVDVETQEIMDAPITTGGYSTSEAAAPQALAVCIGWKTSLAARRGRGRTFLGPVRQSVIESDGSIASAALSTLRTATGNFVNDSNAIAGGSFAIYGQQNLGDPSAHVARDIVGYAIRDQFAVLRSRRD